MTDESHKQEPNTPAPSHRIERASKRLYESKADRWTYGIAFAKLTGTMIAMTFEADLFGAKVDPEKIAIAYEEAVASTLSGQETHQPINPPTA